MSGVWLGKAAWAGTAALVFAMGAAALHFVRAPRAAGSPALARDIVSRAADSELEVSPSLAASRDGTLAIAWIAMMGGRDDGGRYVGLRFSTPNVAALSPLVRFASPDGSRVSSVTVAALGDGPHTFVVTWLASNNVYAAQVSPDGGGAAVLVAEGVRQRPRAITTPSGAVVVVTGSPIGMTLSTTRDGAAFTRRDVAGDVGEIVSACGDDRHALVPWLDARRGIVVTNIPIDPEGPASVTDVSVPGEHVVEETGECFVAGQDAYVVYGTSEKQHDDVESMLADALVFARSKDDARSFWSRVSYRPPTRLLHPALLHGAGTFTLLAVMGGGVGDAHASASVIELSADGRSQNGLTRTAVAPVTITVTRDAVGYMGDALGVASVGGVTWAAVADNASGESHIALVRVL